MKQFKCPFCGSLISDEQVVTNKFHNLFMLSSVDKANHKIDPNGIVVNVIECNECHNCWLRDPNN